MLVKRILSALVGIPLLLLIVFLGDPWVSLLVGVAVIWGSLEFYALASDAGYYPLRALGTLFGVAIVLNTFFQMNFLLPIITAAVILTFFFLIIRGKTDSALPDWALTVAGIAYIGLLLPYFILLRNLPSGNGIFWVLLSLLCIFATDTTAFFVGSAFGRTKLAPVISPKKSWEGAISGFLASILVALALDLVFGLPITLAQAGVIGGFASVVGQIGDLAESLLKRSARVKDASQLIPGHGGLLDRVDSLIFAVVVVYYYANWVAT